MKVGPAVGIIVMISFLLILMMVPFILYPSPPRPLPGNPYGAMGYDENHPKFTLKMLIISEEVPYSDVELVILHKSNDSVSSYGLHNIISRESNNMTNNVSYYDIDMNDKLSPGDLMILRMDWDGPDSDTNNDENFTNEGPFRKGDIIRLIYKKTDRTICMYTIYI